MGLPHRDLTHPPRGPYLTEKKNTSSLPNCSSGSVKVNSVISKMIFRRLILVPRLDGVMAMAERLPVALVPEELLVSSVRNDVVNVGCFDVPAFLHALHAEGVSLKVPLSNLLPRSTVASACCGPLRLWVHSLVRLAVLLPAGYKRWTPWVTAGCVRTERHHCSQGRSSFPKCP